MNGSARRTVAVALVAAIVVGVLLAPTAAATSGVVSTTTAGGDGDGGAGVGPGPAAGDADASASPGAATDPGAARGDGRASLGRTAPRARTDADPTTADEFLATFRALDGSEALERYTELEAIRSQASVAVQSGEFGEAERRRMDGVLDVLRSFERAYAAAENGTPGEALRRANETERALRTLESAGGDRYAALASVALDRFHGNLGTSLEDAAESSNASTPERIALYDRAATAYRRGGNTQAFSRMTVQRDRLREEFAADRDRLNESAAVALGFVEGCDATCENPIAAVRSRPLESFSRYTEARRAAGAASTARAVASEHELSDRRDELATAVRSTSRSVGTFAIASTVVVGGYVLAAALVATVVALRLRLWAAAVAAAETKNVVAPVEVSRR
jgi:hypothetical protein